MMDFMGLMKQAQQMQAKMAEAQLELEQTVVEGEAGGGMVKVTLTAKGGMKSISIDPSLLDARREGNSSRPDPHGPHAGARQGRGGHGRKNESAHRRAAVAAGLQTAVLMRMAAILASWPALSRPST